MDDVREDVSERKFSRLDINANWIWRSPELEDEATRNNWLAWQSAGCV